MNKKKVLNELFHEEKHMNKVIADIRRKIKSFYGWVKQYFLTFQSYFMKTKNNMIIL
jgi:CRISPR/Cas system CMR subunit Cmr6 (Cas7 group RAMP superfamily)